MDSSKNEGIHEVQETSFRKFLARKRSTDPLVSAFLHEIRRNPLRDFDSWRAVRLYLNATSAPAEMFVVVRLAWREYVTGKRTELARGNR
jgi:hypothetical protein